ncbi:MAG: (d)CMP kinase [Gammaproteobacteria bacterium]|nr:(d)CMP kinase [Gammaproteobacteria bacterium]MYB37925.1 (d)CMP kinase [Gammaproteobacteria bacterium]
MTELAPVIAIDGPGGAGKGSVAAAVADELDWHLLDSGALYRAVGVCARRRGVAEEDATGLVAMVQGLTIRFTRAGVTVDGEVLGDAIRGDEAAATASRVAALAPVRAALLAAQRALRMPPGLVADGRDMATVVFPDAVVKVFLTASVEERARRRLAQLKQLKQAGPSVSLPRLFESIRERDERDRTRPVAPLVQAPDAVTIDSTSLSIEEVTRKVLALAASRQATSSA